MTVEVVRERPDTPDAIALIEELEGVLATLYPDESRHGFTVERLVAQGVAFFVARVDGAPAACGGVLLVDQGERDPAAYGEVKRMYVRPGFRGRGLARTMLDRLAAHALEHGVTVLRLETGIHQVEAIGLYEAWGFGRIDAFGPYVDDPLSRYYERRLP